MSFTFQSFVQEIKVLSKLAAPILVAQLAIAGLGIADTLMSGQVGTDDLAAIGLGSGILFPVMMLSIGILMGLTPIVAKQNAKNNTQSVVKYLYQSLWLAIPISFVMWFLLTKSDWLLAYLPLSSSVFKLTDDYLNYIAWGLPGLAFYFVYRFFWEGLSLTVPSMIISIGALLLNIPLNALFIFGFGPIKAYGAAGCGIASAIVMWVMFAAALGFVYRKRGIFQPFSQVSCSFKPAWIAGMKDILALGIPNTFALLFEASLFSLIALFIAQLGTKVIAAHQVAMSYTSLLFMVPLSIALAVSMRTGDAYGMADKNALQTRIYSGVLYSAAMGFVIALITYSFRLQIAELYSKDVWVINLTMTLLVIAALYQVFDAVQVATAGALRGLHSTKVTMWVTLIGYWGLGLGGGYLLAFTSYFGKPLGVVGFWIGIVVGFVFASFALQTKLFLLLRRLHQTGEIH